MNVIAVIRFVGCWFCIIAAITLLILGHAFPVALPAVLAILAIAFAMAPMWV